MLTQRLNILNFCANIKKEFPVTILDTFSDEFGNILALLVEIENKRILVQGLYGPNRDDPEFFDKTCFSKLDYWNPNYAVIVGDWNVALNPDLDTVNYSQNNNPRARSAIKEKMLELDLVDIFRELNPTERIYTWKKWVVVVRGVCNEIPQSKLGFNKK